ncbi:hypothetical protein BC829DRAFT_449828 [Chytridium lagenaria]|nr:hypothetical protein BC829DRAFT_449828 [Chytridium lagenaria]
MSKLDSKERIEDVISMLMREGGGGLGSERKVKAESSGASRARSALGHHHMSSKMATSNILDIALQTKRLTPKEKAGVGQLVSLKGQFSWTKLMDQLSEVVGDKAVVSSLKTKLGDIREQYQNAFRASFSTAPSNTVKGYHLDDSGKIHILWKEHDDTEISRQAIKPIDVESGDDAPISVYVPQLEAYVEEAEPSEIEHLKQRPKSQLRVEISKGKQRETEAISPKKPKAKAVEEEAPSPSRLRGKKGEEEAPSPSRLRGKKGEEEAPSPSRLRGKKGEEEAPSPSRLRGEEEAPSPSRLRGKKGEEEAPSPSRLRGKKGEEEATSPSRLRGKKGEEESETAVGGKKSASSTSARITAKHLGKTTKKAKMLERESDDDDDHGETEEAYSSEEETHSAEEERGKKRKTQEKKKEKETAPARRQGQKHPKPSEGKSLPERLQQGLTKGTTSGTRQQTPSFVTKTSSKPHLLYIAQGAGLGVDMNSTRDMIWAEIIKRAKILHPEQRFTDSSRVYPSELGVSESPTPPLAVVFAEED